MGRSAYPTLRRAALSTRPRGVRGVRGQRSSRVCRKTYAERSVGVRRKAPGAHAETEQMSTARTRVRGVTTKQRRAATQGRQVRSELWQEKCAALVLA